ncbi:MAG: hypothetical protein LBU35_01725, partial [Holosporales bacterium]|nr:hypothetical protein [Holosporales bacterium]
KIEELKAVVLSEKNRLKQMINIGKSLEAEQKEHAKALNQKLELERAYFQEIIIQNHAREAQLTQEISISSTKIAQLQENLNRLAKIYSNMILKYKKTINHLKEQISKLKQNYSRSQLKNFSRISALKSEWDSLIASHKKALAYAKKMEENKALADMVDSKIEANRLHTIASLKTKLSSSEQANTNILTKISALEQKLQKCDQIAKGLYKYNSKHKKWKIRKLNARLKNNRRHANWRQNTTSGNILSTSAQEGEPEDVTIAVSSILNAVLKLNNYNIEKTNASMNILASGRELPEKMKAILEVLQEQFNPEILEKAFQKISSIYDRKQTSIMNTLENAYGEAAAEQIIDWNVVG